MVVVAVLMFSGFLKHLKREDRMREGRERDREGAGTGEGQETAHNKDRDSLKGGM